MNLKLQLSGARKIADGGRTLSRSDLTRMPSAPPAGEVLRLQDALGNFLAQGVSEGPGPIAARVLSLQRHAELDQPFFASLVENSLGRRRKLLAERAEESWRLVHSDADGLPGFSADWHGGHLLARCESPGLAPFLAWILQALEAQARPRSLWSFEDGQWRRLTGEPLPPAFEARMGELRFLTRLAAEPPSDFPLASRARLERVIGWGVEGEALNVFSRRGAWAAAALRAGASSALCLDRDSEACAQAAESLRANGLEGRAEFAKGDAFERLEKLAAQGRSFGALLASPPRASKSSRLAFRLDRGLAGLCERLWRLCRPGGLVLLELSAGALEQGSLREALFKGAAAAGCQAEELAAGLPAEDHPECPGLEKTAFLAMRRKALT